MAPLSPSWASLMTSRTRRPGRALGRLRRKARHLDPIVALRRAGHSIACVVAPGQGTPTGRTTDGRRRLSRQPMPLHNQLGLP
jgi:hypothetical protein